MEKQISNTESLSIITEMIKQAKSNYSKGGSFHFLLWGWTMIITNIGFYTLTKMGVAQSYYIWLTAIFAALLSFGREWKRKSRSSVSTHFDKIYGQIWAAVGIGVVILLMSMPEINFNHNAAIMILAGMGTYVTGHVLKFKPLMFGSFALFLAGAISFRLGVVDQSLAAAIGILLGYLVPGYMLKSRENV